MARHACTFRQSDVTRAIKGAVAAGVEIARCEIDKDGKIIVVAGKPEAFPSIAAPGAEIENEWDSVLK